MIIYYSKNFQNKIQKNNLDDLLSICVSFLIEINYLIFQKKITLLRIKEKEDRFGKSHINTIKTNINLANIYQGNSDLDEKEINESKTYL